MQPKDKQIFEKYFPPIAINYVIDLWQRHQFMFRITKPRHSKLGDYCYNPAKGHTISVNANLNVWSFLVTYLHEVAHLIVQKKYPRKRLNPHGIQWQEEFRGLLLPTLKDRYFPVNVHNALQDYYISPTASTGSHQGLSSALAQFDVQSDDYITLDDLSENEHFELNGRTFIKGIKRRTRVLCLEVASNRQYVVLAKAKVKKIGT